MSLFDISSKETYKIDESPYRLNLGKLYNVKTLKEGENEPYLLRKISLNGLKIEETEKTKLISLLQTEHEIMCSNLNNIVLSYQCYYDVEGQEWLLLIKNYRFNFRQFIVEGRKIDFTSDSREDSLINLLQILVDVTTGLNALINKHNIQISSLELENIMIDSNGRGYLIGFLDENLGKLLNAKEINESPDFQMELVYRLALVILFAVEPNTFNNEKALNFMNETPTEKIRLFDEFIRPRLPQHFYNLLFLMLDSNYIKRPPISILLDKFQSLLVQETTFRKERRINKIPENRKMPLVLDGAFSTELERRGYSTEGRLWGSGYIRDNPEAVTQIHLSYLEAGADVITTASYQASFEGLKLEGYSYEESKLLFLKSIDLAAEARNKYLISIKENPNPTNKDPLIAVSLGCYGAHCADGSEYNCISYPKLFQDEKSVEEQLNNMDSIFIPLLNGFEIQPLIDYHSQAVSVIKSHKNCEIIAFESIPCIAEIVAIFNIMSRCPHIPFWISVTYTDGSKMRSGESISDMVKVILLINNRIQTKLLSIGVNCTHPMFVSEILKNLQPIRKICHAGLIVYPNSGEDWDAIGRSWKKGNPESESIENMAKLWAEKYGAGIIGGCCRTTPETIKILKMNLNII